MTGSAQLATASVAAFITGEDFWRGIVAIIGFLLFWEIGSRSEAWFGVAFPWVSQVPAAYGRRAGDVAADSGAELLAQRLSQHCCACSKAFSPQC